MSSEDNVPAVNPLPAAVVLLLLPMLAAEIVFQVGNAGLAGGPAAVGWRVAAIERFAYSGEILAWMWETGRWPWEHLIRFVSYPFVHGSFTQALIAGVMFVAIGKMVAEVFGGAAMVVIFFVSSITGALVFGLLGGAPSYLIGAFPPVYGMIGAFTWILWRRLSLVGEDQARAFTLIGFLMGAQLLFSLFFSLFGESGGQHEWLADLAAFATGFLLSFLLAPGGWARLLGRLRQE